MLDECAQARVYDDSYQPHATLFPLDGYTEAPAPPSDLCKRIGLNWLAAQRLHEKGWLSFDPQSVSELSVSEAAELRFLGVLIVAGCNEALLSLMLRGLHKPYAYRIEMMYYAWRDQAWHLLPTDDEQRERFSRWVEELEEAAEVEKLEDIRGLVEHAINDVRWWGL